MRKLVVLKLDGDLECQGFHVTLEIGEEGKRPDVAIEAALPPDLTLNNYLREHWLERYRKIGISARIKPKRIINYNRREWIQECKQSGEELQIQFSRWLNANDFSPVEKRLRSELARGDDIRFHIQTRNLDIPKLPWHLWDFFEHYTHAEIAFSSPEFERRMRIASDRFSKHQQSSRPKFKILAILGHTEGIDVESDRQLLENLPNTKTTFLVEPERQTINDTLWEQHWDIIFFAGHSQTEGEKGRIYLNDRDSLTIDELWFALRKAVDRGLKLALFNSCDGLGLARQLDDLFIPQMIVMRESVPDRVAQEFLKYFLEAFSRGQSFYLSVREAREKLQGIENEFPCASWLPAIYQHPDESPLSWQKENFQKRQTLAIAFPRVKVATAIFSLLSLGAIAWHLGAPQVSKIANNLAFRYYQEKAWRWAWENWNLAVAIDPNNAVALYNQAYHCEDVDDFHCAREKYRRSAQLGMAAAHSRLGQLYIREEKYTDAVALLWQGLELAEIDPVKYALEKNLGWARLKQGRYEEAEEHLQKAIALDGDRAEAHCLLAELQDTLGKENEALQLWQVCQTLAHPQTIPEDDMWLGIARSRLQSKYTEKKGLNETPLFQD
jgi:Tfp pilus assembly protein PilF